MKRGAYDTYESWREHSEEMEALWANREAVARKAFAIVRTDMNEERAQRAILFFAELWAGERLMNRRFQLLMLLRGRARELQER